MSEARDWGCDVCVMDIARARYQVVVKLASARSDLLDVYRCSACGQYFRHDMSLRLHTLTAEEAAEWLARIEDGLWRFQLRTQR